jgi:hypothetical protein
MFLKTYITSLFSFTPFPYSVPVFLGHEMGFQPFITLHCWEIRV